MFYIINLMTMAVVASAASKLELLCAKDSSTTFGGTPVFLRFDRMQVKWRLDFSELNVTGKDIAPNANYRYCWVDGAYAAYRVSADAPTPRRYQVLDDDGRSVDIRTWKREIELLMKNGPDIARSKSVEHLPRFREEPSGCGRKQHCHRRSCPAMTKQNLICEANIEDALDGVPARYLPVIDHSKARRRNCARAALGALDSMAEMKMRYGLKSWKHQSKSARQWCKHKKGIKMSEDIRHPRLPEPEIETLQALAAGEEAA